MIASVAALALPGTHVDTDQVCSDAVLDALKAKGVLGVIRYVPLPRNAPTYDISAAELQRILAHGMQSTWVQHVRGGMWNPADHDGEADARVACAHAKLAAYAPLIHGIMDLEAVSGTSTATIRYATDWQRVTIGEGFKAMLYVGFSTTLSADQLYDLHGFDSYMSDAANRRVSRRGTSIVQGKGVTIAGTAFDLDTVRPDLLGELPHFATAVPVQVA